MAIADDGIRVWVDDDQLIFNQWKGQAATLVYPDHARAVARRMVRVAYFDATSTSPLGRQDVVRLAT